MYIFDEYDEYYRNPGGAVRTPGTLVVRLKLLRSVTTGASVSIRRDGGEPCDVAMVFTGVTGAYDVYECTLEFDTPGLFWFNFLVDHIAGMQITIPERIGGLFQVTAYAQDPVIPDWIHGGVMYQIFVDRFKSSGSIRVKPGSVFRDDWGGTPGYMPDEEGLVRSNDFFGGDIYGIINELPYLDQLGVTCIYLSPVFEAASNHKYDTGNFMKVDSAFGGDAAFERLCAEAKSRGIRIILDGVFNHVGADSKYFNKYGNYSQPGAYQGEESPWYGWFTFRENGKYDSWWGIETLPALNKLNESYRDYICGEDGVIAHWTKKGVSGWRLDVVDELPDAFLYPLCEAIKRERSNAVIIGEVWEDASNKISYDVRRRYFLGGQLDSVMNYPLRDAIIACVRDSDAENLADTMAWMSLNYPDHVLHSLMNVLGTHDTERILTALSGVDKPDTKASMESFRLDEAQLTVAKRRLKLAATLQFTLPGVPCVFYGDEAGIEGWTDPFNRMCYPWGNEDARQIEWYKTISRLRRENDCFKEGRYELVQAHAGVFAFSRGSGNARVLVAVNCSNSDRGLKADGFNYDLLKNEYTNSLTVKAGEPAVFAINEKGTNR